MASVLSLMLARSKKAGATANPDRYKTADRANGRFWRIFNIGEKNGWVMGAMDSASQFSNYVEIAHRMYKLDVTPIQKTTEQLFFPKETTVEEVVNKISLVYQDPVNLLLPIIEVYTMCCRQFNGGYKTDSEFRDDLASTRNAYIAR